MRKNEISFQDEDERVALEKFKTAVIDLEQDDTLLIRFLRARDRNLRNAEKMLRACIKWKVENDIASYLNWRVPGFLKEDYNMSYKFTGKDNEGRPVVWIPWGGVHTRECLEAGHKEVMFNFTYHVLESVLNKIDESDGAHHAVGILGLEGLTMKKIMHVESMQTLYKTLQNLEQYYPEVVKYIIVINAPWYFSIVYNFVKPLLSAYFISKLHVFDSNNENWMKFLRSIMPIESIPEVYTKD